MRWERVQQQNQQAGLGDDSSSGPGKRWGHTCNAIKGGRFLYVFGGFGRDNCLTNQVHVFDAETQIWSQPVINGVPPCPRDSHSCTTVGDNLFVFGGTTGTKYLNDLHILDTSSHTWICPDVRGEVPEAREAHSATLVDKRIFIFGGCGKRLISDDEIFNNDLYILNTETFVWKRAVTTGNPPSARDGHTCSTWKNKIIVVGGEDLNDYYLADVHILDTDTFVWKEVKTSGQLLTPRAGHVTIALDRNLFVFGGFTSSQYLYDDLYVLDVVTGVWTKVVAMEEGPSARFSATGVCLDPFKAGLFFFIGGCNKNLEPLDDIFYLHTEGGYARFDNCPGRLSLRKQMKLKSQEQRLAVAITNIDQGRENLPLNIVPIDQSKRVFQARVTENVPLGYTIETIIDGKLLRGVLFSNRHSSVQTADPSLSSSMKRPAMSDGDCDHRAKIQKTSSKDSASSSQQADPIDPSDDANKKVADSNDMDTSMNDINMARPQEAETAAVTSDASQLNMGTMETEPSPVNLDQANVEPLRNEILTDATNAGIGGDSSPEKQGDSLTRVSSVETTDPSFSSRKRPAMWDGDCDHRAKIQKTLTKDSAGSSQQADPIDPSDDANKKVAVSNDMDTPMNDTNMERPQEAETAAFTSDASQLNMGVMDTEPSPVNIDQTNVEPLMNEISTDATDAGLGRDSSPKNQEEATVTAEDADSEQQSQPQQL